MHVWGLLPVQEVPHPGRKCGGWSLPTVGVIGEEGHADVPDAPSEVSVWLQIFYLDSGSYFSSAVTIMMTMMMISVLLSLLRCLYTCRCVLLLAARAPGGRDPPPRAPPLWQPVASVASRLSGRRADRAGIVCRHDDCVFPADAGPSCAETPQRARPRGLKAARVRLCVATCPILL